MVSSTEMKCSGELVSLEAMNKDSWLYSQVLLVIENTKVFFFLRFCLFMFRERGREEEREGEKHQCVVASRSSPHWGPGLQPRHAP